VYEATGVVSAFSLARCPSGQLVLGGTYEGEVDFAGAKLPVRGTLAGFGALFDSEGNGLWALYLADGLIQGEVRGVGCDNVGNAVFDGWYSDYARFGPLSRTSAGQSGYVAHVDSGGSIVRLWSDRAKLGRFVFNVAPYGGGITALTATHERGPASAVHFDEKGNVVFERRLGDAHGPSIVARDASGAIVIAGTITGPLDLGVDPLTVEADPDNPLHASIDSFVARLSP
jgi:hypothetical protein